MSGGVDSAVALLKAGPHAVGVTLRLWLDPARPRLRASVLLAERGDRRARDLSRARPAARHARPARGVPARGRDAVRPRLRARRDAEPVHPLQRWLPLRGAARVRAARRRRRGSRPVTTRASSSATAALLLARAADDAKDQSYMLARARPSPPRADLVPARRPGEGRDARGGGARRARGRATAPTARRRASSPATTTARSSPARGSRAEPGAIVDEAGATVGTARRVLAVHAGPAPRPRRLGGRAAVRAVDRRAHEHRRRRAAGVPRAHAASRPAGGSARRRPRVDGEAPLPLAGGRRDGRARRRPASGCASTSRRTASPADRPRSSTTATSSSVPGWSRRPAAD